MDGWWSAEEEVVDWSLGWWSWRNAPALRAGSNVKRVFLMTSAAFIRSLVFELPRLEVDFGDETDDDPGPPPTPPTEEVFFSRFEAPVKVVPLPLLPCLRWWDSEERTIFVQLCRNFFLLTSQAAFISSVFLLGSGEKILTSKMFVYLSKKV